MNDADDGGGFVVHMGGTTHGDCVRELGEHYSPSLGSIVTLKQAHKRGRSVRVHISDEVSTYKFIINRINILETYSN